MERVGFGEAVEAGGRTAGAKGRGSRRPQVSSVSSRAGLDPQGEAKAERAPGRGLSLAAAASP